MRLKKILKLECRIKNNKIFQDIPLIFFLVVGNIIRLLSKKSFLFYSFLFLFLIIFLINLPAQAEEDEISKNSSLIDNRKVIDIIDAGDGIIINQTNTKDSLVLEGDEKNNLMTIIETGEEINVDLNVSSDTIGDINNKEQSQEEGKSTEESEENESELKKYFGELYEVFFVSTSNDSETNFEEIFLQSETDKYQLLGVSINNDNQLWLKNKIDDKENWQLIARGNMVNKNTQITIQDDLFFWLSLDGKAMFFYDNFRQLFFSQTIENKKTTIVDYDYDKYQLTTDQRLEKIDLE